MGKYTRVELSMDVPEFLQNGPVLIVLFAALAVVSSALTVAAAGGGVLELLYGIGGGIGVGAIVVGVYVLGRRAGHPHSHAVAESGVILGVVLLAAVITDLLLASGILSEIEIALGLVGAVVVTLGLLGLIGLFDRFTSPSRS